MLPCCVAMCVDRCRLVTANGKTRCTGCMNACCIGFVLGDSLGTKPCVFSGSLAPAGDERYLVNIVHRMEMAA